MSELSKDDFKDGINDVKAQIRSIAEEVAKNVDPKIIESIVENAMIKFMLKIGIDVSSPNAIKENQKDMNFIRVLRLKLDSVRNKSILSAIGIIVSAMLYSLYQGIKALIGVNN